MKTIHFILLLDVSSVLSVVISGPLIWGDWVEDPSKRQNLDIYLMYVDYPKVYIGEEYWRSLQIIRRTPQGYAFQTRSGPFSTLKNYHLVANNRTVTKIHLDEIGNYYATTCEIVGNALIAYGADLTTGVVQLVVKKEVLPSNPNLMTVTMNHVKSKFPVIYYFYRNGRFE